MRDHRRDNDFLMENAVVLTSAGRLNPNIQWSDEAQFRAEYEAQPLESEYEYHLQYQIPPRPFWRTVQVFDTLKHAERELRDITGKHDPAFNYRVHEVEKGTRQRNYE